MARVGLENVSKDFHDADGNVVRAVQKLSFETREKEFVVLLGPSGCGKTTTLRLIAGLETPDSGSIRLDGQEVTAASPRQRDVAMVFQSYALYPHLTVHENIALGLKLRGCPRPELNRRVSEAIEFLGLQDCIERKPASLSGGQRQRAALGRALVRRPRVLLLDEPLSNLDAPMRLRMRSELLRLHHNLDATIIYVTHEQLDAMSLGQRIAVLNQGRLEQFGTPREIYHQPATKFVAAFVGYPPINFFEGTVLFAEGVLWFSAKPALPDSAPWTFPLAPGSEKHLGSYIGEELTMGVRPEAIHDQASADEKLQRWQFEAAAERIEAFGADTFLRAVSFGRAIICRLHGMAAPNQGQKMVLTLDVSRAHFFDGRSGKNVRAG